MMTKLIEEVKELVEREYGRAGAQHGLTFSSDHQAYAVILEEYQEAKTEINQLEFKLSKFWDMVKRDADNYEKYGNLTSLYTTAIYAACELIQVAAMAKKEALTVCERGATEELKREENENDGKS